MARTRTPLPAPVKRIVLALLVLFVVIYLALPQLPRIRSQLYLLGQVNLWLVLLAVVFEAASILSFTNFMKAVIPQGRAPDFFTLLRIQLSTFAISHVVPGGAAAGGALGFRLLTRAGLSRTDAAFALATQGLGSAVVLNVLLWLGLVISIPLRGFHAVYATAALLGVLLIGGFSALVILLVRGEQRAADIMRAVTRRVPLLDEHQVHATVIRLAGRLQALARDRDLVRRVIVWDLGFWLFTAAALWVWVRAFGHAQSIDGLIVPFGLAYVVAALPLTPMGVGVMEPLLISLLTLFGAPSGAAALGVLGYRLVNFWLPIPIGALAYLSLAVEQGGEDRERRARERRHDADELARLAEESLKQAEDRHTWAERHGLRTQPRPKAEEPEPPRA